MSVFKLTEEEKAAIRKQHEEATKNFYQKKADEKAGIKPKVNPEEKKVENKKTKKQ